MSPSNRDDFLEPTKRYLAESVAYRCSFPGCHSPTLGPSNESGDGTTRVGMAAHIAAAAGGPGARRFVKTMTADERRSADNGIWMCYTHGKLVDDDEVRFTIPMLKAWKKYAELRARIEVESCGRATLTTDCVKGAELVFHEVSIPSAGKENELIGRAIDDSCLHLIWGHEMAEAVRDFLIETARNALTHGKATFCRLEIEGLAIRLIDDGQEFNPWSLEQRSSNSGGALTVRYFLKRFGDRVVANSRWHANTNEVTVACVHRAEDVRRVTPCTIEVSRDRVEGQITAKSYECCEVVYLLMPLYLTISDMWAVEGRIRSAIRLGKKVVFVVSRTSFQVRGFISNLFPDSVVLQVDE